MVRLRLRIGAHEAHYGGQLVDGARVLQLFGDAATELCVRLFGDEGLFRAYESVEFLAPVRAGDFLEIEAEPLSFGTTSFRVGFEARRVLTACGGHAVAGGGGGTNPDPAGSSAAELLPSAARLEAPTVAVARAVGTCVVPVAARRYDHRPGPLVITAAIVGAEVTREQTPYLPITADELAAEAERCAAAGASVIHLHVRHPDGSPTQDRQRFSDAISAIRGRTDVIIQTSTGGAVGMGAEERAQPLDATPRPEMASLNVASMSFGEGLFANPLPEVRQLARRIAERGVVPEVELYDLGHIGLLELLLREGYVAQPLHLQFVLGVRGGAPATIQALDGMLASTAPLRPPGSSWGVAAMGRHQLAMAEQVVRRGGHVRVGLEDNIYLEKGVLSQGSAPLVERVVALARAAGRPVATVADARRLLGLSPT
jgi:3-keto-5-aminohexanoate cleavage enzyme